MEQRIPGEGEATPEAMLERIAAAEYHGACLDPNVAEIDDCLKLGVAFDALGLACMVNAFPHDTDSLEPLLEMAAQLQATQVNVIGGVMPLSAGPAILRRSDAFKHGLRCGFCLPGDSLLHSPQRLIDLECLCHIRKTLRKMRRCRR